MENKKRERSANFNNAEVQLFVSLVERHQQIIENKKTDAVTNRDIESAWKKIEISFNSCGIATAERSWKTLKLKYEEIKKGTKKKSSVQRQAMYRTRGGSSNAPEFTEIEEKVISICFNIKGLEARHDSDTIQSVPLSMCDIVLLDVEETKNKNAEENNAAEDTTQDISVNIPDMDKSFIFDMKNDTEPQKENKWVKWHPKALKTRVSNVLKPDTINKASVSAKLEKLSSSRLELVQLQMETKTPEKSCNLKKKNTSCKWNILLMMRRGSKKYTLCSYKSSKVHRLTIIII